MHQNYLLYLEQIKEYLKSINIEFEENNNNLVRGVTLDIYVPSKKIAINILGAYLHSDRCVPKNLHLYNMEQCKVAGIQLIQLWEDQIYKHREVCKSLITAKLGALKMPIYARECIIKEVSTKEANKFCDESHLQGRAGAKIKLGLYTKKNNELVAFMSFSMPRVNLNQPAGESQWEVVRYCNKLNTNVVGGPSKLFKYFIKNYKPTSILSFSSNDISIGGMYKQLGFNKIGVTCESYWYLHPMTLQRDHRTKYTRKAIAKHFGLDHSDKSWTERSFMDQMGYYRIFDSAQTKWIWTAT